MKRAWIFGDSHAAGSGILNDDTAREYLESYPCQLARTLGYRKTLNYSIAGHSNDAIFRWVTEQIGNIQPEDLVILCWTEQARTEIWSDVSRSWLYLVETGQSDDYDTWYHMRHCDNALQGILDVKVPYDSVVSQRHHGHRQAWEAQLRLDQNLCTWNMNFQKNCLAANHVLRNRGITAMNIRSLSAINLPATESLDTVLAQEWWPVGGTVFRNWALQQGFLEDSYHHLPMAAHTAFADYVYTEIKRTR